MATKMFAETLDNSQHLTQLNPKSWSYTKPTRVRKHLLHLGEGFGLLLRVSIVSGNIPNPGSNSK
jgi:hypothetical protein